jgi:hypothetical protein
MTTRRVVRDMPARVLRGMVSTAAAAITGRRIVRNVPARVLTRMLVFLRGSLSALASAASMRHLCSAVLSATGARATTSCVVGAIEATVESISVQRAGSTAATAEEGAKATRNVAVRGASAILVLRSGKLLLD